MKVKLNPTVEEFKGAIGGMVYKKHRGKQIACARPDAHASSEAQIKQQDNFKDAALWAKSALKDSVLGPAYQLASQQKDKPAFALAVKDYCKPPVVKVLNTAAYLGRIGDSIEVVTSDDFGVIDVQVRITNGDSDIESGSAVEFPAGSGRWQYTAKTQLSRQIVDIIVAAKDRPGGIGHKGASVELN